VTSKQFLLTLSVAVISGVLGGALSVWFLMPQSVLAQGEVPKVIKAQQFLVVDQDGNVRANLGASERETHLSLLDEKNQTRVLLSVHEGNPALILLHNDASTLGVPMTLFTKVGPSIQLYDSENQLRTALGSIYLKNTGTGSTEIRAPSSLVLFDEKGNVVWSAP